MFRRPGAPDRVWTSIWRREMWRFFVYVYRGRTAYPLIVTTLHVEEPAVPAHAGPIRFAFATDLHMRGHWVEPLWARFIARLRVQMFLLGGDFQPDGRRDPLAVHTGRFFAELRRHCPDLPIVAVLGNHDRGFVLHQLERYGVRVLLDEVTTLPIEPCLRVGIIGVRDPHKSFPRWERIATQLSAHPDVCFWIVLAHSPDVLLHIPHTASPIHMVLAGHTHGGQICYAPNRPIWHNTRVHRRFAGGLTTHRSVWVYTSRGLGYTLAPIRIMCPPEIVLGQVLPGTERRIYLREDGFLIEPTTIRRIGVRRQEVCRIDSDASIERVRFGRWHLSRRIRKMLPRRS